MRVVFRVRSNEAKRQIKIIQIKSKIEKKIIINE